MPRGLLSTVALPLVSVAACLAALEIGCRLYFAANLDYQIEMTRYAAVLKQRAPVAAMSHQHVPSSRARLMGVEVETNSAGFRDREYPLEKPPGAYRILVLGDSLTLGWGVEAESRYSEILERRLEAEAKRRGTFAAVEVINTGIGNYNTSQEVAFFRSSGRAWRPDLVLLGWFINDSEPTPTKRTPAIFKRSQLAMLLWGRLDVLSRRYGGGNLYGSYYAGLYDEAAEGWRAAQAAFAELAALAREDGFPVCVFLLPELHAIGPRYGFSEIHARVEAAMREAGIPVVVDLAPRFASERPEALWVSMDDAHPNAAAHAILADAMHETVAALVFRGEGGSDGSGR
jgi:lysophospholipase L1-like esterase